MVWTFETEERRVTSAHLVQINRLAHNISEVESVISIIQQNEKGKFYVLSSTEIFLASSVLRTTQASIPVLSVCTVTARSRVSGMPDPHTVRKIGPWHPNMRDGLDAFHTFTRKCQDRFEFYRCRGKVDIERNDGCSASIVCDTSLVRIAEAKSFNGGVE